MGMDHRAFGLLGEAKYEIKRLREQNKVMGAKLQGFEMAHELLTARVPHYPVTDGPDLVMKIDDQLKYMEGQQLLTKAEGN